MWFARLRLRTSTPFGATPENITKLSRQDFIKLSRRATPYALNKTKHVLHYLVVKITDEFFLYI